MTQYLPQVNPRIVTNRKVEDSRTAIPFRIYRLPGPMVLWYFGLADKTT